MVLSVAALPQHAWIQPEGIAMTIATAVFSSGFAPGYLRPQRPTCRPFAAVQAPLSLQTAKVLSLHGERLVSSSAITGLASA